MRAMILAAGRGERMRPLTDSTPKPMLEVAGVPMIERHVRRLGEAGFTELVINTAHLAEQIEQYLGNGQVFGVNIRYSREPPGALETAGGIRHALPLLGDTPFLLVNGDIRTDFDFSVLHKPLPGKAHLVMVDNPPQHPGGDFVLENGRLRSGAGECLTYSGVGVYRPEAFAPLTPGSRALGPLLKEWIAADAVSGEYYSGAWFDVGTPARLQQLNQNLQG